MPKIKLLDNLIVGDGKTLAVGTEIDTEKAGIDIASLDNLLGWGAVEVIGASDSVAAVARNKEAAKPVAADPAVAATAATADPVQAVS